MLINQFDRATSKEQKKDLAHRIEEILYDHASFVPGFLQPFYRVGYWDWVKWPAFFNHKHSDAATTLFVHWIDEEAKQQVLAARRSGQRFEPRIEVYDQSAEQ